MKSRHITELVPGDFVKVNGRYSEISTIHGISSDGRLSKLSDGGFSVMTKDGKLVSMWAAESYAKREDFNSGILRFNS